MLFMLFIPQSFGKEKKSILQRIEEADSIPVYINLTDIELAPFANPRGVPLTNDEIIRTQLIPQTRMMPSECSDLLGEFVAELNRNFQTNKFYGVTDRYLPKEPNNLRDVNDPEAKLIVVTTITMKYDYDIQSKPIRRYDKNLTLTMKLNGGFDCNFLLFNFEEKSMKVMHRNGGFVYGDKFNIIDIPIDVATLMDSYNPLLLMNEFKNVIVERITKNTEKLYSKSSK